MESKHTPRITKGQTGDKSRLDSPRKPKLDDARDTGRTRQREDGSWFLNGEQVSRSTGRVKQWMGWNGMGGRCLDGPGYMDVLEWIRSSM